MPKEPSRKPLRVVVGRYALFDEIASGGMATVHYGRLMGSGGFSRTVAVKRLHAQFARDPEFVAMFLDEARLAARIRHPNVVPTLDVVSTDDELFLVMEYVAGEALHRLMKQAADLGAVIPPRVTVSIMCGALRGLHAAHEATSEHGEPLGIVHRDVSPQNVLVAIDGQARVLDFGVAKAAGRIQTTRQGTLKGKLGYMSPEQLGGGVVDRRSDIFAASTVLWEALSGHRLFRGDNDGATVTKIIQGNIDKPSVALAAVVKDAETLALVRAVDDVVLRGLAREVDGRYDTARAMAADLEKAVQPAGVSEVSDWVEHFAADALKARAAVVSRIESQSGVDASELADLRSSVSDFAAASQSKGSAARLPPPSGDGSSASAAAPIALVKRSVNAAAVLSDRSSPSSRGRLALVLGGLVVVLAAVGAVARTYAVQPVAVVAQPPSSAVPVVSAASSPPEPWRAPASSAASPAALSASAAPSQHPEQTTGSGDAAVSVPASRPGRSTPHPKSPSPTASAAAPAPNCNPPFTYDADGLKHFKPDCLQ